MHFLIYYTQLYIKLSMVLISMNFGSVQGSSQGISHAFHTSYLCKKNDKIEQQFTLLGSTVNIHENWNRQGHNKKNVLFESHIW